MTRGALRSVHLLLAVLALCGCSHATADGVSGCVTAADCPADFPYCRDDLRCWSTGSSSDAGPDAIELDATDGGAPDVSDDAGLDATDVATTDAPDGGTCLPALPDVGGGDFSIELDVRLDMIGTHAGAHALASQRDVCNAGHFWTLWINDDGFLAFATDDEGTSTVSVSGCLPVHDGVLHRVVVQRVGGVVDGFVDGEADFHADASVVTPLTMLPALTVGTDACVGSGVADFPFGGASVLELRCIRTTFEPLVALTSCP